MNTTEIPIKVREKYLDTIPTKKTRSTGGTGQRKVKCLIPNISPRQLKECKIPIRQRNKRN